MTVFVAVALTALTFALVTYPFFRQRLHSVDSAENEKLPELYSQRDTTYSMLKELEFDFQSGILTEEDYRNLEARYKSRAISILRGIDNLAKEGGVEEEIEKQVLELRRAKGQFCPQCGTRCQEGDRFCSRCGTGLSQGERID
jgi:hypothetical protein